MTRNVAQAASLRICLKGTFAAILLDEPQAASLRICLKGTFAAILLDEPQAGSLRYLEGQ